MGKADNREEIIEVVLAHMAAKPLPTAVEITERVKRKYWIQS